MTESIHQSLLELFFPTPRICPLCEKKQPKLQFCAGCQTMLSWQREEYGHCQRCHTYGISSPVCDNCRRWPAYYQGNTSVAPFSDTVRDAIIRFKYHHAPWLAKAFAVEMAAVLTDSYDCIVPVPLHWRRLYERGYNQSALLAKELSLLTGIPWHNKGLLRTINTAHQTELPRTERINNLQNAFKVNAKFQQQIIKKRILLVDDVLTTGTTLLQCAKILHQAGAKTIGSITIATGKN